jgi:hypothetical protein
MSKHRQTTRSGALPVSPARTRAIPRVILVMLAVASAAAFSLWWWKSKHSDIPPTIPAISETVAKPEFQKLKGKWLRPDGDYAVEIKSVDDGGKMDEAYFNPFPIHVSRAEASMDGGAIKVFIELRAPNYPGSTYTLV